jgi:hypothetical protein
MNFLSYGFLNEQLLLCPLEIDKLAKQTYNDSILRLIIEKIWNQIDFCNLEIHHSALLYCNEIPDIGYYKENKRFI